MSNEVNNPKVLVCPSDTRTQANSFDGPNINNNNLGKVQNAAISYFVGKDADETFPAMLLSGDRNVCDNPTIPAPGPNAPNGYSVADTVLTGYAHYFGIPTIITTGDGWSPKQHNGAGNVGLSDGSVQQVTSSGFRQLLSRSGDINGNANYLLFP